MRRDDKRLLVLGLASVGTLAALFYWGKRNAAAATAKDPAAPQPSVPAVTMRPAQVRDIVKITYAEESDPRLREEMERTRWFVRAIAANGGLVLIPAETTRSLDWDLTVPRSSVVSVEAGPFLDPPPTARGFPSMPIPAIWPPAIPGIPEQPQFVPGVFD